MRKITSVSIFIVCLTLLAAACTPNQESALIPAETLVAQTMQAIQATSAAELPPDGTPIPPAAEPTAAPLSPSGPALPPIPEAACVPAANPRVNGRVTRVIDGSTIEISIGNDLVKIGYLGVKTPRLIGGMEYLAPLALDENRKLVNGQVVTLVKDTSETDANGRLLRYVFTDRNFVNLDLLRKGVALAAVIPPDTACQNVFLKAEQEAQAAALALWGPTPAPTLTPLGPPTATPYGGLPTPTRTSIPTCDCFSKKALTCNSFSGQRDAQKCFEGCKAQGLGDLFGLDKNNNGVACEGFLK
jgi:endonuclease YncB( thermonuclease family)